VSAFYLLSLPFMFLCFSITSQEVLCTTIFENQRKSL